MTDRTNDRALDLMLERGMGPGEALHVATLEAADDELEHGRPAWWSELEPLHQRAIDLGWDADTRPDALPVDEAAPAVVAAFVEGQDSARVFSLTEGSDVSTATLGELRNDNAEDPELLSWLDTAEIGDVDGGFNSLRVERIR